MARGVIACNLPEKGLCYLSVTIGILRCKSVRELVTCASVAPLGKSSVSLTLTTAMLLVPSPPQTVQPDAQAPTARGGALTVQIEAKRPRGKKERSEARVASKRRCDKWHPVMPAMPSRESRYTERLWVETEEEDLRKEPNLRHIPPDFVCFECGATTTPMMRYVSPTLWLAVYYLSY